MMQRPLPTGGATDAASMSDPIADGMTGRLVAHLRERTRDLGDRPHRRPVSDYVDARRHAIELRALFRELPIVVAHSSQLAAPGDFLTDDRLGVPLLLVRLDDGRVAAHLNVCPHRGSIVESQACGQRRHFECPYHGWSFGLDGQLLGMTDAESFAGLDPAPTGLRPVAVAEKYGLIFVRVADGPPIDLDAFLGPMAAQLETLQLASYRYFGTRRTDLRCNWKVQQEGSLETYHFNTVHAGSIARQFNGMAHAFDRYGDHQRFVVPRRKLLEKHSAGMDARDQMLPTFFLFPNTAFTVPHDHAMFVQVFPRSVGECTFENAVLVPADGGGRDAGHWQRALELTQSVNAEDFTVIEGVQRGCEAGAFGHLVHGRYEQGITAFHESIDRAIERSVSAVTDRS